MYKETYSPISITNELLQLTSIGNIKQLEDAMKDRSNSERLETLITNCPQIKMIHQQIKNHPEKISYLKEGWGDDTREHIIYNDTENQLSIRITPEGFVDVLTQLNPADVKLLNSTDFDTVKEYSDRLKDEEPPIITVVKKSDKYNLVLTAEDSNSGGSHRIVANRLAGNEKMWAFLRLTDSDGNPIKLFRYNSMRPSSIEKHLAEFIEVES